MPDNWAMFPWLRQGLIQCMGEPPLSLCVLVFCYSRFHSHYLLQDKLLKQNESIKFQLLCILQTNIANLTVSAIPFTRILDQPLWLCSDCELSDSLVNTGDRNENEWCINCRVVLYDTAAKIPTTKDIFWSDEDAFICHSGNTALLINPLY